MNAAAGMKLAAALLFQRIRSEIEQVFKFLFQSNAQDQGQFGGRVELACFNGADGVARDAYHFGKLRLG